MGQSNSRFLKDFKVHNDAVQALDYTVLREGAKPIEMIFHKDGVDLKGEEGSYVELKEDSVILEQGRFKVNSDIDSLYFVVSNTVDEFNRLVKFCKETYDEKLGEKTPLNLEEFNFCTRSGMYMVNVVPVGAFKAREQPYTTIVRYKSPSLKDVMRSVNFAIHVDNSPETEIEGSLDDDDDDDDGHERSSQSSLERSNSGFGSRLSTTSSTLSRVSGEHAQQLTFKNFLQVESKVRFKKLKNLKTSSVMCYMNRKGEVFVSAKFHMKIVKQYSKHNKVDNTVLDRLLTSGQNEKSCRLSYFTSSLGNKRSDRSRTCKKVCSRESSRSIPSLNYDSLEAMHFGLDEVEPDFIILGDNTVLAYRKYQPKGTPLANVIYFPPIGGDGKYRRIIGVELLKKRIGTFIVDIRGHGYSGGKRGHVNAPETIWEDVRSIIRIVKWNNPNIPIFLAGDSISAGLLLHYLTLYKYPDPFVSGICMLSPLVEFMVYEKAEEEILRAMNIKADLKRLTLASLTKGKLFGGKDIVKFKAFDKDGFDDTVVDGISGFMLMSSNNIDGTVKQQFEKLTVPIGAWVGELNEVLLPEKILLINDLTKNVSNNLKECKTIPDRANYSIFENASEHMGSFIERISRLTTLPAYSVSSPNVLMDLSTRWMASDDDSRTDDFFEPRNVKVNYIEGCRGNPLPYQYFQVTNAPVAKIVLLSLGNLYQSMADDFARTTNAIVYVADIGFWNKFKCGEKLDGTDCRNLIADIDRHVKFARYLKPENIPLFLIAHGPLCHVLQSFVATPRRDFVEAFVFLSPLFVDSRNCTTPLLTEACSRSLQGMSSSSETVPSRKEFFLRILHCIRDGWKIDFEDVLRSLKRADGTGRKSSLFFADGDCFLIKAFAMSLKRRLPALGLDPRSQVVVVEDWDWISYILAASEVVQGFMTNFVSAISVPKEIARLSSDDMNVSNFEFLETVGIGAVGKVLISRFRGNDDRESSQYFAVKCMKKKELVSSGKVGAALREKKILSMCHSPFIVSFVGSMNDVSCVFIVMEYLIGGELFTKLRMVNKLDITAVRFYFAEILLAVEYLHKLNIVHRDIKTTNVLISASGHVKLIDLDTSKITKNGRCETFCGTLQYMAPEIILRKPWYDGYCADVYALGIVCYELLFGEVPFRGNDVESLSHRILQGIPNTYERGNEDSLQFVKDLTSVDPAFRVGGKSPGIGEGSKVSNIRSHPWLSTVNFQGMENFQVCPPFIPKYVTGKDSSNFVAYKDAADSFAMTLSASLGDSGKENIKELDEF
eukprot:Nk52_evm76s1444 gene=Nk52_evmTU76s1444